MADGHEETSPPSYTEATSHPPNPTTRAPPFPSPPSSEVHYVSLVPGTSPVAFPFPEPSSLWLNRDVRLEDWAAFTANLVGVAGPCRTAAAQVDLKGQEPARADGTQTAEHGAHIERMRKVLASWNAHFFEPRGLRIVGGSSSDDSKASGASGSTGGSNSGGRGGKWKFGPDKFGFQVGGALLGLDISKPSAEKK